MSEPICKEVEISVRTGGSVQIVKFNLRNDFGFTYAERYTVPTDWSEERLEQWKVAKTKEIKDKIDQFAQVEQDALLASADWYDE